MWNTHQVDYAVFSVQDILLKICPSDICHYRYLHVRLIVSNDIADVLLITELPLAELLRVKNLLRCLISKLHIVNACLDVSKIQISYKFIRKGEIIHQTTIS